MKIENEYGVSLRYYKINKKYHKISKTTKNIDNSQYDMRKFRFRIKRMNNQLHKNHSRIVTQKIGYEILQRKCLC